MFGCIWVPLTQLYDATSTRSLRLMVKTRVRVDSWPAASNADQATPLVSNNSIESTYQ
eukprot:SAG22_NODE_1918_length_3313_cov_4.560361_1_plen_57_part_10